MKMSTSLINTDCKLRVSSVLDKNQKEYGKQNMIDNCEETCWNSAQGSPQWIELRFPKPTYVAELHIQFQGGFAGKDCWVEVNKEDKMEKLHSLYPADNNSLQVFSLEENLSDCIRVMFGSSTDFYGRIIVYKFDAVSKTKS